MSPRDWRLRVDDIVDAIEKIQRFVGTRTLTEFAADELIVDTVLRNIPVIGESARHIAIEVAAWHPEIPWPYLRGMRNLVVHEYFGVDLAIVWDTAVRNLPSILPSLRELRSSAE